MTITLDATNAEFSRRWYEANKTRFLADNEGHDRQQEHLAGREALAGDLLTIRDNLFRSGDIADFQSAMKLWSVRPHTSFNGTTGQMVINQLVKHSGDHTALARVLTDALRPPGDDKSGVAKISLVLDYITTAIPNAKVALNSIPFVLSYFWSFESDQHLVLWPSAAEFIEFCTGLNLTKDNPGERYRTFAELARVLDEDPRVAVTVAGWWAEARPVFLDPVLVDRSRFAGPSPEKSDATITNAQALVRIADYLAKALVERVSKASGRSLTTHRLPLWWIPSSSMPRGDLWVDWRDQTHGGLGLRLWIDDQGTSIGLRPGRAGDGWYDIALREVRNFELPGYRISGVRTDVQDAPVGHSSGESGDFTFARWFTAGQLSTLDLVAEVTRSATEIAPLMDRLIRLQDGPVEPPPVHDNLATAVEQFRHGGYPTPADVEHHADRRRFEGLLSRDNLWLTDPLTIRSVWNTSRYSSPGPQAVLNTSFRDADADELERILRTIEYICWGGDNGGPEDADRIDEVLTVGSPYHVKGLGESVAVKLLAICHHGRYLPVFPYSGSMGKRAMLNLLGLPEPTSQTRGGRQVESNDVLRKRLDPSFPGDPWGAARFLYWYAERVKHPEPTVGEDPIADLADELLVDRSFLDELIELLHDKGQIVLYGPPGTGKTYLARKLAEVIAPDPNRRSLVQFHPSTSYEDFFEGYRPEVGADGGMSYRLTPGPLALLADRAAEAPGTRHVMIIDEINRANLPKVLGELLFLLEYRDERVRTLYRPEDAFELPKDLWFIGTMNTADRSIALVDAALRRRFHFVPFFPSEGPMQGLLDRWLKANEQSAWIGELVTMVNDDLIQALGGPHLQLGPSHFMKKGLTENGLRRIWRYNIEPFIEDQFFGDNEQIARFRFDAVIKRFNTAGLSVELATASTEHIE